VSSYGSYWRAGEQDRESAEAVLRSAVALEAPVLRIWAGARPSAEADEAYRELVVEQTLMLARMAFAHGIVTAFEYHSHSLTDCTRSALQLLRQVREQGVRTYWQPPGELGDTELIRSLQAVLPDLAYLHVFHWDTTGRCPLEQGVERWLPLLRKVAGVEREVWALLEFVRGDSVASFREDAAVLRGLAARVGRD
jgi:sugar phosphate isomerase/epimerase